jgi:PAS domain S-box-containing protein
LKRSLQKLLNALKKPAIDLLTDRVIEDYYVVNGAEVRRDELIDFFQKSPVGLHWVDASGTILWANREELEMLGYSSSEYVGRNLRDFYADSHVVDDLLRRLERSEVLRNYEARLRCKNGVVKPALIDASSISLNSRLIHARFPQDAGSAWTRPAPGDSRSVTDESRHRLLGSILDSSPHGIMTYESVRDAEGQITDFRCILANRMSEALTGQPPEVVTGKLLSALAKDCDPSALISTYADLVENDKALRYELSCQKDGETRWFFAASVRLNDGYTITFEDITERKHSESLLEGVMDSSLNGIIVLLPVAEGANEVGNFRVIRSNRAAELILGLPERNIRGKLLTELHASVKETHFYHELVKVSFTGEPLNIEYKTHSIGKWLQVSAVKTTSGIAITFSDITARKSYEETLAGVMDSSLSGIIACSAIRDESGHIVDMKAELFNQRAQAITGVSPEEFRSSTLLTCWPALKHNGAFADYVSVIETGRPFETEKFSEVFGKWLHVTAVKVGDGVSITFSDVSSRKLTEATLRGVLDSSLSSIAVFRPVLEGGQLVDLEWVLVNPATERLTGKSSQELLGRRLLQEYPGVKELGLFERYVKVLETGEPMDYEYFYSLDGFSMWCHTVAVRTEQGISVILNDITAKKKTRQELRDNQQLLKSILDSSPNSISALKAVRDESGTIVDFEWSMANTVASSYGDKPPGYYPGKRLLGEQLLSREIWNFDRMVQVVETGVPAEHRMKCAVRGKETWFESTLVKMGDGVVITLSDVTSQVEAAEKIKQNELFISSITNTAPSLIAVLEPHSGRYLFVSEAVQKILGYTSEEILERGVAFLADQIHPDDLEPLMEKNARAIEEAERRYREGSREESIVPFEYRLKHKEGHWVWLNTFGIPFKRHDDGRIEQLLNISIEVNDRKRAEEQLKESSYFVQRIADSTPNMLYVFDLSSMSTVYINRQLTDTLGYSPEEILKMGNAAYSLLMHPADLVNSASHFERYKTAGDGETIESEFRVLHKNGSWRWIYARETVFKRDKEGTPLQVLGIAQDVTDRRETGDRLQQYELLLEETQRIGHIGSWEWDLVTSKVTWTDELYRIFGYEPGSFAMTYDVYMSHIHPEDREALVKAVQQTYDTEESFLFKARISRKDGSEGWIMAKGKVTMGEQGQPLKMAGIVLDITEQKKSEMELRESQHTLKQITDSMPNMLYVFDIQASATKYVNREIYGMLGYTPEEVIALGDRFVETLFHPEDYQRLVTVDRVLVQALRDNETAEFEYRLKHRNGEWRWMYTRETVFRRNEDGGIQEILGIAQDITERKQAEESFHELTGSLQNAIEGIAILDKDGRYFSVNNAKAQLLGYEPQELTGMSWLDTIHPEDREVALSSYAVMREQGKSSFEVRGLKKDGSILYKEVTFVANTGSHKEFKGWYSFLKDISERKIAEKELLESKIRFEAVFNQTFQYISLLTPEGLLIDSNRVALDFRNADMNEIRGQYFPDRPVWADRNIMADAVIRAAKGEFVRREIEMIKEGHPSITVDFSIKPIYGNSGEILHLLAEGRDISERKHAEREMMKSRRLLAEAEKVAHHGSWEWEVHSNTLIWSDELHRIYDLDPEGPPVTFDKFMSMIMAEDVSRVSEILQRAIQEKNTFSFEHKIIQPSGSIRILFVKGKVLEEEGQSLKLLGSTLDITEQKLALEQLLKTEGLYRTLARNIPNSAVILYDRSLRLTLADGAALSQLGFPDDMVGHSLAGLFGTEEEQSLLEHAANVFSGTEQAFEKELLEKVYKVEIIPVKNSEGEIFAGMLVLHDITEIKKYQEELEFRIEELNRSNASLEQFAYVASHDLQEPLRKIRTFGGRLTEKYSSSIGSEGKDYIDRMQNAAQRMQTMIDDLLSYSRLSRSEEPFVQTNLGNVVRDIVNDFEVTIEQKKVSITFEKLPVIEAMPGQMQQLFQNLISNAIKFSRTDVSPAIHITCEIAGGDKAPSKALKHTRYCKISIRDNGIGFDEKYSDRIFTIFQRLHGRSEYAGTGIGLAICKKIVENHHGTISVRSRENKGTTFTVVLPMSQQTASQETQLALTI